MTCTTVELLDKFITTGAGALQLRIPDEEEEPGEPDENHDRVDEDLNLDLKSFGVKGTEDS